MNPKKILLLFLLALGLLLLSGCVEMDRTQKTLCYSLTTKSYAYVPECNSEKTCFAKVNALFKTNFDAETESQLFYLKNKWARSWFFYNRALSELKKAPDYCLEGDAAKVSSIINQTSRYLDHSFTELDSSTKRSFDIISAQEKILTDSNFDLVKEEPLFDSLIEMRQILAELSSGQTNSGTYVSFYLSKVNEFNQLGIKKGFGDLIETDSIQLKSFGIIGNFLYEIDKTRSQLFPLLGISYENMTDTVENLIFSSQSLKSLSKFPISEFTTLYSSVAGNQTSSLKSFADLMNKTSKNRESALATKNKLEKEIESGRETLKEILLNQKQNNNITAIESYFSETKILAGKTNEEKIGEIEQKYFILRERQAKGTIKLGEELFLLKSINLDINKLIYELSQPNKERLENISLKCDMRANTILAEKNEYEQELLLDLKEEANYYSNKTINTKDEEKFYFCEVMLKKEEELLRAKKEYSLWFKELNKKTTDCFNYLNKIVPLLDNFYINEKFNALKNEMFLEEKTKYFSNSCENIKSAAQKEIETIFEENGIREQEKKLSELTTKYYLIKPYLDESSNTQIKSIIYTYISYFEEKNITDALLLGKDLAEKMKEKNNQINDTLNKYVIDYAVKNSKIVCSDFNIIKTNKDLNILARFIAPNPFWKIEENVSFNLDKNFVKGNLNSECFSHITLKNKTLQFWCLDTKDNYAEVILNDKITTSEKKELIYSSNKKSLLMIEITLKSQAYFSQVEISTKKISPNYKIHYGDEEIFAKEEGSDLFFIVNYSEGKKINVYFYIDNLISTTKEIISTSKEGLTEDIIYKIKARNNSELKLESTLTLPVKINGYVESVKVENGTSNEIKAYLSDEIVLKNQTFLPLEEREYYVYLKTTVLNSYYTKILENLQKELEKLEKTEESTEIEKLLKSPENYSSVEIEKIIKKYEILIEGENSKQEEILKLESAKTKLLLLIEDKNEIIQLLMDYNLEKEGIDFEAKLESLKNTADSKTYNEIIDAINLIESLSLKYVGKIIVQTEKIEKKLKEESKQKTNLSSISEIFSQKRSQLSLLFADNLKGTQTTLEDMKNLEEEFYSELNTTQLDLDTNETDKIQKIINECFYLIKILEINLKASEAELIKAKFILPITPSRIKKIKLELLDINSLKFEETTLQKVTDFWGELKSSVDSIKKQTIDLYNKSIDEKVAEESLKKSKEYIDSNEYITAFLTLAGNKKETQPNYSLVLPILIIVAVALIIKTKYKKKEQENNSKKEVILNEWNN